MLLNKFVGAEPQTTFEDECDVSPRVDFVLGWAWVGFLVLFHHGLQLRMSRVVRLNDDLEEARRHEILRELVFQRWHAPLNCADCILSAIGLPLEA